MELKASHILFLVMTIIPMKAYGFSFNVKSPQATKVTATPGNIITHNAHLAVSDNTTLSFHVSLPYFQTPILNVEKIKVVGKGVNVETSHEVYSYSKGDSTTFDSHSEASIDFGNVTWNEGPLKHGDDLVVEIQSRLLNHANVTSGKVFWLYFGMHYQNDAVWVVGKSVKVDLQSGPADIGVSLKVPDGHKLDISSFEFEVDIYHLPGSKGSASSLKISLSTPSTLSVKNIREVGSAPAFDTTTTDGITITFTEPLSVGKKAKISVKMTYDGSEKGKFVLGNIYGSFEYQTDPDGSGSCTTLETVKRNEALQLAFKFYSSLDTCDEVLSVISTVEANSAMLPCCAAQYVSMNPNLDHVNWEVWMDNAGVRLPDEYLQHSFDKKTTVRRILMSGFAKKKQFVRSFFLSYSQNGVHWNYVTDMGKKKEFQANTNAVDMVMTLLSTPLTVWFLRIHVGKHSPAGASLKLKLYGCQDDTATKPYETYQRGFIADANVLVLCNVHPEKNQAKPNCFSSPDEGLKWEPMHPSIVNVIGYDSSTEKMYGLGVTSEDTPIYMEIVTPRNVRVISEADWTAAKSGCTLPKIIPLFPVHGNPFYPLTQTSVMVGGITYIASPEGLLKNDGNGYRMIASWTSLKTQ